MYFRLEGDRLWLQADNTPLVEILEQFVRTGVEVRVDPRIQSNISGSVRGMALDHALEDLLEPYDYLVTWKILGGPLGSVPKLQEIRLFLPGSETAAKPIPRKSPVFEATRGVLDPRLNSSRMSCLSRSVVEQPTTSSSACLMKSAA